MSSGILSRSANTFALTLPFRVLELTPETFIYPEASNDAEDSNNVGPDATYKTDLFTTALIL